MDRGRNRHLNATMKAKLTIRSYASLLLLYLVTFTSGPARCQSAAGWEALKRQYGLPSSLTYNEWVRQGCPINNGNGNKKLAPMGPSPEQRAAERDAIARKQRGDEAYDLNQQGIDAYDRSDYEAALTFFQDALDKTPDDSQIKSNIRNAKDQIAAKKQRAQEAFEQSKQDGIRQLKGISQGDGFDSETGLKGIDSTDSGLKAGNDIGSESRRQKGLLAPTLSTAPNKAYLASLKMRLDEIQVPPPIPSDEAEFAFCKAEEDPQSEAVLTMTDAGVAVVDVVGKVGGKEFPPFGLIVITGKTLIAAEDAADVYIVKRSAVYDQALAYLKDKSTRDVFAKLVTAVRTHQKISTNVSIKMLAAARAVADPTLNDKTHDWQDALWAIQSPPARRAALTRLLIEGAGVVTGEAMDNMMSNVIHATQSPAYEEANLVLKKAKRALASPSAISPDAQIFLRGLIERSNNVIASAYRTEIPKTLAKEANKILFDKMTDDTLPHP